MPGDTFLEKYSDHNDPVTVIDKKRNYGVKASARHPVYENFRVKVSNCVRLHYRQVGVLNLLLWFLRCMSLHLFVNF